MTDVVLAPRSSPTVPANEWLLMSKQAEYLAQSDIIPVAYRRKPANIVVAALTGRTHGWDVLTAMRNGHVIEGQWGMKPEAMLGLVRAAGHAVDIVLNEDGPIEQRGAVVTAHRVGEHPMIVTFTIGMAAEKGLVQLKDGKPWARSSQGKRLPWEQYPVDMCMWRAVGKACRAKYSDITLGIYTAEELGASINAEGEIIDIEEEEGVSHAEPMALSESVMEQFGNACTTEGLVPADVYARAFPEGVPDPLTDAHLPILRDAFKRLVGERAAAPDDIEEAEVVDIEPNFVRDEIGGGTGVRAMDPSPDPERVRPASRSQIGAVKGQYERLEQPDRDMQLMYTADFIGRPIKTHNDLTFDEASQLLDHLGGLEPA